MSQARFNAAVIDRDGNSKAYAPSLAKGDKITRMFASDSSEKVYEGGVSLCISDAVTLSALNRAQALLDAAFRQLPQHSNHSA